ncbi:MAG: immune inhibitor A [Dehalococcoidia bacterium]|nr:MAG: immune inhibitor A [Dehalococcoidia bacterium]
MLCLIGILLCSALVLPVSVGAESSTAEYDIVDIGPDLRAWDATRDRIKAPPAELLEVAALGELTAASGCILDTKYFLVADYYTGYYFFDVFYLIAEDSGAQVWLQADLSWPAGDPRSTPEITCEQAQYILNEFSNNIQITESSFFGPPDFHDGAFSLLEASGYFPPGYYGDVLGRQIILISNIRDNNYYDPDHELYVGGFFSPQLELYFDRNTVTVDAYDWVNRLGPDCDKPYLYEGVLAHEYQHLLHYDYDPFEEDWINEGLSDWAEVLCGYGIPVEHVEAIAAMPENSLVFWGDQGNSEISADYGIAYMYQQYMYEQFGQDFIQAEFQDSANQGIYSVDSVLSAIGESDTFADTFHNFSVALYTSGAYSLEDLATFQVDVGRPGNRNLEAYATDGAPPWGTDYYLIWGFNQIANFHFNGNPFKPLSWSSNSTVLWSGTGNLVDNWAIFEATGGGTLTFDTFYDIEDYWDFGFVQVSTDGGYTWTSLGNAYTTSAHDPGAHPTVVANLPGLTWLSVGWVTMSFDLSAYAGDILIAFRYVTDWATVYDGWYIDNVYVDSTLISDGSSTDACMSLEEVLGLTNDYTVTLIGERIRKGQPEYEVVTMMSGGYISDWEGIRNMFNSYRLVVMLVTYDAPVGTEVYSGYTFEMYHH